MDEAHSVGLGDCLNRPDGAGDRGSDLDDAALACEDGSPTGDPT